MKATLILMALLVAGVKAEDEDSTAQDFAGAVLRKNAFSSGRGCIISEDGGMAYANSRGSIISTDGYYFKTRNNYIGKDGTFITRTRNFFWGTSTTIKASGAYMNEGGVFVGSSKDND